MDIEHAYDLLKPGESAIVLRTNGYQLIVRPDGAGSSGNWKIRRNLVVDRVIMYVIDAERVPRGANVYVANYVGATPSPERDRSVVLFQGSTLVGTTDRNWWEIADAQANPVRYLTGK